MRKLALALSLSSGLLVLLAPRASFAALPAAKLWTGGGRTDKASESANWLLGERPQKGDWAVFGALSSKDCDWDLHLELSNLTLSPAYKGTVRLAKGRLAIKGESTLAGGRLELGEGTLVVGQRLLVDGDGSFQLGGGEIELGPNGLLVVKDGTLLSTGERMARIRAATGEAFPIEVQSGHVRISNAQGTVVTGSKGIVLFAGAKVDEAKNVHVRNLALGAPALKVFVKKGEKLELAGWSFDQSVQQKVESPGAPQGAVEVEEASPETVAFVEKEAAKLAAQPPEPLSDDAERSRRDVWTGAGPTRLASDPANWSAGRPRDGDLAVFPAKAGGTCRWDLSIPVRVIELRPGFEGEVDLGTSTIRVTEDVIVAGGVLRLDASELSVAGRLTVRRGGTLDTGEAALRLGPDGLLLDGGRLTSTGRERAAAVSPLDPSAPYAVRLAEGSVSISSPAGAAFDGSMGIDVRRGVQLDAFDGISIVRLAPGRAGLTLASKKPFQKTFRGWSFDGTAGTNVDASRLAPGSVVTFADASGERFGSANQKDPLGVLRWQPDNSAAETQAAQSIEEEERPRTAVTPLLDLSLLGGQYFFQNQSGALTGNADLVASASVKPKDWPEWTVIPILQGSYRGTKQVTDLVGGGTLFQQSMDYTAAVRGVYELSDDWRLKPQVGYKVELLRETLDETWGHGLFDYDRPAASLEAEYLYHDPFSVRFVYDFYLLQFPNYTSLASQAAGTQGLAPELVGKYVINSTNNAFSVAGTAAGPKKTLLEAGAGLTLRSYGDQHIVEGDGSFISDTRLDEIYSFSASLKALREPKPGLKSTSGLELDAILTRSNQNSYDAQQLMFLPNYYAQNQFRATLSETASFKREQGGPWELQAAGAFGRIGYPDRPVQDVNGAYQSDDIYTNEIFLSATLKYPIADHFNWMAQVQWDKQLSNMDYQKLYIYNYSATAYMVGFTWAY